MKDSTTPKIVRQAHEWVRKLAILPLCEDETEIAERLLQSTAQLDIRRSIDRRRF